MRQPEELFRDRCSFQISLRMELFEALQTLLDPISRIHPAWKRRTLSNLPPKFTALCERLGGASEIWPVIPAVLPKHQATFTFEEIISSIESRPLVEFQREILTGLIHFDEVVVASLKKGATLKSALGRVPKAKQNWLNYIGLYPYEPSSPMVVSVEYLIADPKAFRETLLEILRLFWVHSFKNTWNLLQAEFQRSLAEKERLFQSCSVAEFAQQALLRVEVNEDKASIKAIRGGYELPFRDVLACTFIPSAFNDRRYWSALKDEKRSGTYVYFPYFDPSIALDLHQPGSLPSAKDPELDPALIFKALGDSTRYAIISLVARNSMSSADLAERLSVSKPTISHHVHQLRDAGLLDEKYQDGAVQISLRRDVVEKISEVTIHRLFHSDRRADLKTTRRKQER